MRNGFSMIELVFVVVILGVLTAVAVPRFVVSREDACVSKMRAAISETEVILAREYTKRFMQGVPMTDADKLTYLKTIEQSNSNKCEAKVNGADKVNFLVGSKQLAMDIKQDQTTKAPIFWCDLANDVCKLLLGRKSTN